MHLLVIGGESTIGSMIAHVGHAEGWRVIKTSRSKNAEHYFDLSDDAAMWNLPEGPGIALISASITSVNLCETNREMTDYINVKQTIQLINFLNSLNYHIIFLSTSLVFDGNEPYPLPYNDICPITVYGKQKAHVENYIRNNIKSWCIIRLSKILSINNMLFSKWYYNIVNSICVDAFGDAYISPLNIIDIAKYLFNIMIERKCAIYHVSATDQISYAEAAELFINKFLFMENNINFRILFNRIEKSFRPTNVALGGVNGLKLSSKQTIENLAKYYIDAYPKIRQKL